MLSPYDDQHGFIEYHNGHFVCFLPDGWSTEVDKLRHSKATVIFKTVVQSEVFKGVVEGLREEGTDVLKNDLSSCMYGQSIPLLFSELVLQRIER